MAKRPNEVRLAELDEKARKIRIETAIEKSPALQEVRKALRCLERAKSAGSMPEPANGAAHDCMNNLATALDRLGDVPPKAIAS